MAFWNHKKTGHSVYDKEKETPMIRASICTGEKVAGFRRISDGHFTSVKLIRDEKDLEDFRQEYGIREEIETFY